MKDFRNLVQQMIEILSARKTTISRVKRPYPYFSIVLIQAQVVLHLE